MNVKETLLRGYFKTFQVTIPLSSATRIELNSQYNGREKSFCESCTFLTVDLTSRLQLLYVVRNKFLANQAVPEMKVKHKQKQCQ